MFQLILIVTIIISILVAVYNTQQCIVLNHSLKYCYVV